MSPPDPGDSRDRNSSDLAVKGSWKTGRLGHKTKIQQSSNRKTIFRRLSHKTKIEQSGDRKTIFGRLGYKTKYHQRRRWHCHINFLHCLNYLLYLLIHSGTTRSQVSHIDKVSQEDYIQT